MVIALRLFHSGSVEEDSLFCLLLPNHYVYVLSALCVCMHELYVCVACFHSGERKDV